MSKGFLVKFSEEMLESLRKRGEEEGEPVAQVIKKAVSRYLGEGYKVESSSAPAAIQAPRGRRERMGVEAAPAIERAAAVPEMTCRGCGHGQHVHTNQAVSSGTGCVWMGCACRGFRV